MQKVISLHEYELKPGADELDFEKTLKKARQDGLFKLPGLIVFHFLKGIRGKRSGRYAALWIYKNIESWERLWGPEHSPKSREEYPENWKIWEEEILAKFLSGEPDKINFTSYETI